MITTRDDGTFVIEKNGMPYHVIESDVEIWDEVQQRLLDGEETEKEIPYKPSEDHTFNRELWMWELSPELELIKKEQDRVNSIIYKIRERYSIDDEISMIYKDDTDVKKVEYRAYVASVKEEFKK